MNMKVICHFCERELKYSINKEDKTIIVMPCRACVGIGFTTFYKNTRALTKSQWEAEIKQSIDGIIKRIRERKIS